MEWERCWIYSGHPTCLCELSQSNGICSLIRSLEFWMVLPCHIRKSESRSCMVWLGLVWYISGLPWGFSPFFSPYKQNSNIKEVGSLYRTCPFLQEFWRKEQVLSQFGKLYKRKTGCDRLWFDNTNLNMEFIGLTTVSISGFCDINQSLGCSGLASWLGPCYKTWIYPETSQILLFIQI